MTFTETPLRGSFIVELQPFSDDRGWFARYYCKDEFKQIGHNKEWMQLNHSVTYEKGAIRGMHYQNAPFKEVKLVRCIAGAVFDAVIDLRRDSVTFLKWFGIELSAENKTMLYIAEGFAHGFQCLTDDCELLYHHTESYMPVAEAGIRYNDPKIGIQWPLPLTTLSSRDANHPLLDENFKGI